MNSIVHLLKPITL